MLLIDTQLGTALGMVVVSVCIRQCDAIACRAAFFTWIGDDVYKLH